MNRLVPNIVGSAPPTFVTNNNINNDTIYSRTPATNRDFLIHTSEGNTPSGTSIENAICLDSDQSDDDDFSLESTSPLTTTNNNYCQSEPEPIDGDGFETEGQDVSELEEDSILTTQTHTSESPIRSRPLIKQEKQTKQRILSIEKKKYMRKMLIKRKQKPTSSRPETPIVQTVPANTRPETPIIQMVPANTNLNDLCKMWEQSVNSGQGAIIIVGMNQVPSIIPQTEQAIPFTIEKKEYHVRKPMKGQDIILWLEDADGRRFVDLASIRRYTGYVLVVCVNLKSMVSTTLQKKITSSRNILEIDTMYHINPIKGISDSSLLISPPNF